MEAYTDGACRCGNPGETSCAFAVFDKEKLVGSGARYLGVCTNNWAEYQALIDLLMWSTMRTGRSHLDIYSDSKLVVNQVNGDWDIHNEELRPLCSLAYALLIRGGHYLHHIKGHAGNKGNEYVDGLCNEVLDREFERRKNAATEKAVPSRLDSVLS